MHETPAAETPPRPETAPTRPAENGGRVRLDFLDGLRGLSALYVLLSHTYYFINWRGDIQLPNLVVRLLKPLEPAHLGVAFFIVLSGYCLMLPVARSADGQLRGGAWAYLKRRARRILPPYYAALILPLLLMLLVPKFAHPTDSGWDAVLPAFDTDVLLSHLFVVQNANPAWSNKINDPLWSVAPEWQIYFLLPLLLLPVWRRFGNLAALATAFFVGIAPHFLTQGRSDSFGTWYVALFGMGMVGAVVTFSPRPLVRAVRDKTPWMLLALLCFGFVAVFAKWKKNQLDAFYWFLDPVMGAGAASLIVACARQALRRENAPRSLLLRLFEAKPTVALGHISYSLYLMHFPILGVFHVLLRDAHAAPLPFILTMLFVGLPTTFALTLLFYRFCERPFVNALPAA